MLHNDMSLLTEIKRTNLFKLRYFFHLANNFNLLHELIVLIIVNFYSECL